nr:AAA-ATPase At3g28580-like [Ipomoea batatas]
MDDHEEVTDVFEGIKGEAIAVRDRKAEAFTQHKKSDDWHGWKSTKWSHVIFKHPSNFKTLAMEPTRKQEIMEELHNFTNSKDYYAKIGKAWKRGYLLHGPPGTGKSSMIAAMANLLQYDVYDLELTAVKDNSELRKLLIETSCKSIIKELLKETEKKKGSEVTLSGLLNVIDGLWSAIGEERIIVFTTNYIEKLDPALIRRGRMDSHIELSYCCFEAFKVLAKNYLDIESHELFPEIRDLLGETKITPADVAENLMPKSGREKADICLKRLIKKQLRDWLRKMAIPRKVTLRLKKMVIQRMRISKDTKKAAERLVKENGDTKKSDTTVKENGVKLYFSGCSSFLLDCVIRLLLCGLYCYLESRTGNINTLGNIYQTDGINMSADPAFVDEDGSSGSADDMNMLDGHGKHRSGALNSGRRKRSRKATGDAIVDAMLEIAAASKMRAAATMRKSRSGLL